jgi:enoyl-[acyl-carrier-protein] reductase (NADH)
MTIVRISRRENVAGHNSYMNDRVRLGFDLVSALAFLGSDASRWITGRLIHVNCGLSLVR